jgi:hypothetical protein
MKALNAALLRTVAWPNTFCVKYSVAPSIMASEKLRSNVLFVT